MRGCDPGWMPGITPCTYIVGGELPVQKKGCESDMALQFVFFYGNEAEQFAFYEIPKILMTDPQFASSCPLSLRSTSVQPVN